MALPKEPRQLMINLMYLVLTAMLALNVSSEILHAFKTINQSITSSNGAIVEKNTKMYSDFDANQAEPGQEARIKPYNDRAKEVRAEAEKSVKFLEDWKEKIITESGGRETDGAIKREDNIDASTLLLVERKGGNEIRQRLLDLKKYMIDRVKPEIRERMDKDLSIKTADPEKTDNNPQGDWATGYFYNMPTMAVITLLSKFQNDIRNSESVVVNELFNEAGSEQLKFDEIKAVALTSNSYALAGQKIEAQIMLAAYNKKINPSVSASTGRITKVENGVAYWETSASGTGLQKVKGTVSLNMGSKVETREWDFSYMVGSTGASMQLDKMNVFYIGVPNPITVSAAGYSIEDISVSIPGANLAVTGKGKWDVTVTTPGKVMASINAKTDGGVKQVGAMEIRVKTIPDPTAKIAGKSGGTLATGIFKAQIGIPAVLENFDFDTKFVVTSFECSWLPKRGEYQGPFPVQGASFEHNPQVNQYQTKLAKPGDKVFIENIKAVGPDKRTRTLNNITLTLN
ncbi:MAG: gliding motility protein GldM [Bacteroidetes bacterium]|nr:gliding motility protein GldM [Bacteroidota bacterium]